MTDLTYASESNTYCRLCKYGHGKYVCDCSHRHEEHVFGVGCAHLTGVIRDGRAVRCDCECYSQKGLRKAGDIKWKGLHPVTSAI